MSEAPVQQPSFQAQHVMAAVADIMRSPVTTVQQNDHAAAATYLMKHAGASALPPAVDATDTHYHYAVSPSEELPCPTRVVMTGYGPPEVPKWAESRLLLPPAERPRFPASSRASHHNHEESPW